MIDLFNFSEEKDSAPDKLYGPGRSRDSLADFSRSLEARPRSAHGPHPNSSRRNQMVTSWPAWTRIMAHLSHLRSVVGHRLPSLS